MNEFCAEKNCAENGVYGMRWNIDGVRVEFALCADHFDEVAHVPYVDTGPEPLPLVCEDCGTENVEVDGAPILCWPCADARAEVAQ